MVWDFGLYDFGVSLVGDTAILNNPLGLFQAITQMHDQAKGAPRTGRLRCMGLRVHCPTCRNMNPSGLLHYAMWVVVKIMVPFWVPVFLRHLLFRVPKMGALILTTTHVWSPASGSDFGLSFSGLVRRSIPFKLKP